MRVEDCFELGHVAKPHGIRGEVKVAFDVQDIYVYQDLESVYLSEKGKLIPFFVDVIRIQGASQAIVKFRFVEDRDRAESLQGSTLFLPLTQLPELDEGGFFYHEIEGYTIQDEVLGKLGTIKKVLEMPAQDLIVMDYQGEEVLIPIMDGVVLRPDREQQSIHTHLPEGLLEVYFNPEEETED